jgi:hypothetical protein
VEIFEDEPCNAMGLCTFLRTAYFWIREIMLIILRY